MQSLHRVSAGDLQRFLDAPEELLQESRGIQVAVASFPETPRSLLEVLVNSNSSSVAEVARLHVNWVGEVTENYQEVVSEILRNKDLGENDRLAVELMKFAPVPPEFLSEWVPVDKLIQGLKNEYMPLRYRLELLERLAQEELEARLQVAESLETPVSLLELLAGDLNLAVRLAVEYNDNCPSDAIDLVKSQHDLASDWDADIRDLEVLGESRWSWVRLAIAQNPYSPQNVFMKLAADEEFRIRLAVAKNPGTSADVLNVLMESDTAIYGVIAENPNATEEILYQLFSAHRDVIKKRENLPASILERFFRETFTEGTVPWKYKYCYLLLRQPNTPTWILSELANVDLEALRADKLVTRSRVESETLEKWILDDIRYLKDIAQHPQVSEEILIRLAEYPNPEVKVAVAQNDLILEELKEELLEELAVHPKENIRIELAKHISTPAHILEKIGRFEFYQTQLLKRIRKIIVSDSKIRKGSIGSMSDSAMTSLKNNILFPAGISIDIESWMKIFETPQLIKALRNQLKFGGLNYELSKVMNDLTPQWIELLPNLPNNSVKEVVKQLINILEIINIEINHFRSVAVTIVGNPSTPSSIRKRLQTDFTKSPDEERYHSPKENMLLALACNPQVTEAERMGYIQQMIDNGQSYEIAEDIRTPVHLLEQLLSSDEDCKKPIAKNPATPEYLLRRIAEECDERLWVTLAENPNTPVDLLLSFLNEKPEDKLGRLELIFNSVIDNPNSPILTRYSLLLEIENCENIAQVNEFMARRLDSPFALAQVLEKGDRKSKVTLARNSKTPASIIEQLVRDDDERISELAVENPNLPFNTALELARNSTVGIKLSLFKQTNFRNTPPTPPQILGILAEDKSERVRAAVAAYSHTPVEILVRLANDSSREVKSKLIANLNTPVEVLTRLGLEENLVNQRNPNTPGIVLTQAVRNMDDKDIADFIKHPVQGSQMPSETLAQLATNSNNSVRYLVAYHRNTPATALRQLARDSYVPTVRAVASNRNTSPETLEILATHSDFTTRLDVARNANVSPQVLAQIVISCCISGNEPNRTVDMLKSAFPGDNNDLLRTIASNPRTPTEALEILARREFISPTPDANSILPPTTDDSVVQALAYNPSLTPNILNTLTQDSSVDVRKALVRHPNLTEELWLKLAEDETVSVREAVAYSNQTPADILELLASDEEVEVRIKVATNSITPLNILEKLAGDENSQVRKAVASNPNISITILEQLVNDEKIEVRRAVNENPNNPENTSESSEDDILEPNLKQTSITLSELPRIYDSSNDDLATVLTEYTESDNEFVRFVVLLHPITPKEMLTQGTNSTFWLERYAVAENEATSLELLETLAGDGNWIVRAAANQSLSNIS